MEIVEARSKAQIREFGLLPYSMYRGVRCWVPPLRGDQLRLFRAETNPLLQHCNHALFLLRDGGKTIGRVAAFVDHLAVDYWKRRIGFFGSYECPDDPHASRLLLDSARAWLELQAMDVMRGPISFASQEWGFVVEGFEHPPTIMAPYNKPYYGSQAEAYGLRKAKDLIVYEADVGAGYTIPERYLRLMDDVALRHRVQIRPLDMKRFQEDARIIMDLSNLSIADNWGYYPVTEAEAEQMARDLKQIVHPEAVLIAEVDGRPIGFSLALPDVNLLLKGLNGHLLPFGIFKLLWGLPRLTTYRLFGLGVHPDYHGLGIDSLLYARTWQVVAPQKARVEIDYVLEDNVPMNNALRRLGVTQIKTYRVYEMPIGPAAAVRGGK
jgi:GNAT superfamily N-acetyltransferase